VRHLADVKIKKIGTLPREQLNVTLDKRPGCQAVIQPQVVHRESTSIIKLLSAISG